MPSKRDLGLAIRTVRTQLGINQSQLAQRAGLSASFISLIERGARDAPFDTLEKIATALGVPLSILVFLAGDRDKINPIDRETCDRIAALTLRIVHELRDEQNEPALPL